MDELTVLIVDDDPDISTFIRTMLLSEAGHFVISVVESGLECIEHLKSNRVDCILSDYQMPGMDGMELLKALRESGDETPFIFITGQGNEQVARDAFKAGANDYFTKDIGFAHFPRIINSIEQSVRQRRAEQVRVGSEKALLEERNKLKAILSSIGDGLSIQDTDYRILYQNALIERMGGRHIGECCYSAYEGKDDVCEGCPLKKSFEDGGTHRAERCVIKDGVPLTVDITTSPIHDASGKIIGGIEMVRNVSERKAREKELLESESRFRSLVEGSTVGVVMVQDERFVYANPRYAEIAGFTVEEITGMHVLDVVHPDDREMVRENIRKRVAGEVPSIHYQFRMLNKQGGVVHLDSHGARTTHKGRPAVVGSVIDISEQTFAMTALRQSLELLETVGRAEYHIKSGGTPGNLFRELLVRLIELTDSSSGFIGEVLKDGEGRPYLKTYALVAPGCKMDVLPGADMMTGSGIEFHNIDSLFGRVLSTSSTVISNDPANDPGRSGLPAGHIDLPSFMGTPFLSPYSGEMLGMVGLGGRPGGYDSQTEGFIRPFIITCANIMDAYRNERRRKKAEDELALSQSRLLKAQSIAKLGYWDWDIRDNTLHWSDEIYRIFGTSPQEFGASYEAFLGLVHPDDRALVEERVDSSIVNRTPYAVDHRIVLPDGKIRFLAETGEVSYDESGAAVRMMGTVLDITGRKKAEEELRDRGRHAALGADVGSALTKGAGMEQMLQGCAQAMVEHLDAAFARIWITNGEGSLVLKASAGMYTHLDGKHGRVAIGAAGFKIGTIAESLRPHLSNDVQNDPDIMDHEWAAREGLSAFAGHPLVIEGRLVGVMAMFSRNRLSDATLSALAAVAGNVALGIERKRASAGLQESEENFRSLVEESLIGAFVVRDGRFVYVNPRLADMYGYTIGELLDAPHAIEFVHPDDRRRVRDETEAGLRGPKKNTRFNCRVLRKDGSVMYIEALAWSTQYQGKPAVIGTVQDVTDRKRAEAERASIYHMLTHDIKGPLTIIQGYEELLREMVDEEGARMLTEIRKSSGRISALLKDMLDISRLEAGRAALKLQPVSAAELMASAVKDGEIPAAAMDISLQVEPADGLPRLEVDADQVGRALANLVGNAIAYNRRGGNVTLRAFAGAHPDEIVIEVADTGIGIAEGDLPHVFDMYYRAKATAKIHGTGLGLAIVKAIAEAHGGSAEAESSPGQGSTFRMRLPAYSPPAD